MKNSNRKKDMLIGAASAVLVVGAGFLIFSVVKDNLVKKEARDKVPQQTVAEDTLDTPKKEADKQPETQPNSTKEDAPVVDESGYIGVENAKTIALEHAKMKESDASFIKTELETENGVTVYEIEFYAGNTEYDYTIDANSGSIIEWDNEAESHDLANNTTDNNENYITIEEAKTLALEKAPKAELISCTFEQDDGKALYEGELREGKTEYDFEIDAVSGSFLKWEVDNHD